jgi:hypothetical protein
MSAAQHEDDSLAASLHQLTTHVPEQGMSVGELVRLLGRDGLLLFSVLLALPFLLPVQIPGVSTIFGALILLIGIATTINTAPWLPGRVARHHLTRERLHQILDQGDKWVGRLNRIAKPRLYWLTHGPMLRLNGVWLILAAALLMMPLALIPFSNTLPAIAIMLLAVGCVQRDGVCVVGGLVFVVLTLTYFGLIFSVGAAAVVQAMQGIFPFMN